MRRRNVKRGIGAARAMLDALEHRVLLSGEPLNVPVFNSNPGAKATLFLDFDGDTTATWDTGGSYHPGTTPAFDSDGDPTTFSAAELSTINEVCLRVAEKYSPFNVNVTTVDPGTYADKAAIRVVIGGDGAWTGGKYGGISFVGAFIGSDPNTGWVFSKNLGNYPKYIGEAVAHEAGHMFGLQHQSTYDASGNKTEYNAGDSKRAPIMGNSYLAARGLWWSGTSSISPTTIQDDVAIISATGAGTNNFGYRPDEAGNTLATAASLAVSGNNYSASGVITTISDLDFYKFTVASSGNVSFNLNVAPFGAMLDGKMLLENSAGTVLVTADTDSLGETVSASLTPGTYYIVAASHGGMGDIGQYTLSGSFSAATVAPPNDPANLQASVVSPTQVHLAWTDQSSDETGFTIEASTDGTTWNTVGTVGANVTVFDDSGASPGTTYQYRISAFNNFGHSGYSLAPAVTTWGGGSGLRGDYFDDVDFSGNTISQVDANINFDWQSGAPVSGISAGTYSVRWTGQVQALETGTYTFSTTADDGVRLWVNGQLLIDRFSDVKLAGDANGDGVVDRSDLAIMLANMGQTGGVAQGDFNGDDVVNFNDFQVLELSFGNSAAAIKDSGSIALQAGVNYDIKLEYYQQSGPASVKLEWLTPSAISQVIPQSVLFPAALPPAPGATPSGASVPYGEVEDLPITPLKKPAAVSKLDKTIFSVIPVAKVTVAPLRKPAGSR